jgi:ketosteroid isomerase-like protein
MSENLELVQAAFEAYFRGDEPALLALFAPDIVITQALELIDAREYHGREGFGQVMADWAGSWDDWSVEILDAREVGDWCSSSCVNGAAEKEAARQWRPR